MDQQYRDLNYQTLSIAHKYGDNVHIVSNPYWISLLNRFSSDKFDQPLLNIILKQLYSFLCAEAIGSCVSLKSLRVKTRMAEFTEKGVCDAMMVDPESRFICVDLARAGILPSQVCFENLSTMVNPKMVRQDHFYMNRKVNNKYEVIGVDVAGSKIGGDKKDAWVLFPDPMAATGGSLSYAVSHYKEKIAGDATGFIALNLIVTPEYLKRMKNDHPEVHIFALRLDRGLSAEEVLGKIPGELWDQEVGLTDKQYIVPGAGGVGEVLNNSYI